MRFDRFFAVTVTSLAAGAILYFSGRVRNGAKPPNELAVAGVMDPHDGAAGSSIGVAGAANPAAGERRFLQTCAVCHGAGAQGQPHMGANLSDSRFIREQSDEALVAFVKTGRSPGDPRSVLGLTMPPMGGNPSLQDSQIRDIVAFLRTVQARTRIAAVEAN